MKYIHIIGMLCELQSLLNLHHFTLKKEDRTHKRALIVVFCIDCTGKLCYDSLRQTVLQTHKIQARLE